MADVKDDAQYNDIIKVLKGLPRIDAAPQFEMNLRRRLNSEQSKKVSWKSFLTPRRLVPSAALAAAAVMLLFVTNIQSPQTDDPLSMEPQVRQDLLSGSSADEFFAKRENQSESISRQSASSVSYIMKSGLNFRQVNLSDEEKAKLQELKEKFKKWIGTTELK